MTAIDSVETWRRVVQPEFAPLVDELMAQHVDGVRPALLSRLRDRHGRDVVEVALELSAARRKAGIKFGDVGRLVCDVVGVAQASGRAVAEHKALRFAAAPAVVDLCCGIGGDTMALARQCAVVRAVDRSPLRAWMAGHNAGVPSEVRDVVDHATGAAWVHVDPARRQESGRRLWRYADYEPSPAVLEPILASAPAAAVKLGPGVDWRDLPARDERELEFIGHGGGLLQAVMWCGELVRARGEHTATRLGDGLSFHARPDPVLPVAPAPRRLLLVPDPALERAHLVAPRIAGTSAAELAPGLGLLTTDESLEDPWFEEREIVATLPWRLRKIRRWLAAHDGGLVTARSRGGAVDTDRVQIDLRGDGTVHFHVFGLRFGRRLVCMITR